MSESEAPEQPPLESEEGVRTSARRPYRTPLLLRLGSVRDLTLGHSAGFPEGAGTFRKPVR